MLSAEVLSVFDAWASPPARRAGEDLLGPAGDPRVRQGDHHRAGRQRGPRLSAPEIRRPAPGGSRQRGLGHPAHRHPGAVGGPGRLGLLGPSVPWWPAGAAAAASLRVVPRRDARAARTWIRPGLARRARDLGGHRWCSASLAGESGPELPRPRHRQGGRGRALPGAQEHPHRARDRHPDHAGDAPCGHPAGHHGRLLPRLGGRCDPVPLHHAQLHPRGAADRRRDADVAGLHEQPRGRVRQPGAAGGPAPAVPLPDPRASRAGPGCARCCAARRSSCARSTMSRRRRPWAWGTSPSSGATSCPTSCTSS